jgi:hypothetical protein
MKNVLIVIFLSLFVGAFPAYGEPLSKSDFKLSQQDEISKLKAKVAELEKKLSNRTFGDAYITEDGRLKCKGENGQPDWDWNGKTWTRLNFPTISSSGGASQENCPLPLK